VQRTALTNSALDIRGAPAPATSGIATIAATLVAIKAKRMTSSRSAQPIPSCRFRFGDAGV
jgi:hypothetical protein